MYNTLLVLHSCIRGIKVAIQHANFLRLHENSKLSKHFEIFLQLAGLSMLAIGIWAHTEKEMFSFEYVKSVFDFLTDVSILCIITGCLIFLLGFCGCLGALRENTCLIKTVSFFVLIKKYVL